MSNKLVKVEDNFYEEDEINIYDLINIFLKNIKIFSYFLLDIYLLHLSNLG